MDTNVNINFANEYEGVFNEYIKEWTIETGNGFEFSLKNTFIPQLDEDTGELINFTMCYISLERLNNNDCMDIFEKIDKDITSAHIYDSVQVDNDAICYCDTSDEGNTRDITKSIIASLLDYFVKEF